MDKKWDPPTPWVASRRYKQATYLQPAARSPCLMARIRTAHRSSPRLASFTVNERSITCGSQGRQLFLMGHRFLSIVYACSRMILICIMITKANMFLVKIRGEELKRKNTMTRRASRLSVDVHRSPRRNIPITPLDYHSMRAVMPLFDQAIPSKPLTVIGYVSLRT